MSDEQQQEKPKRRQRKTAVDIIRRKGESALVQWEAKGRLHRAYVPVEKVDAGGKCASEVLAMAIPHGAPWEDFVEQITITPEEIANALRRDNFWTAQDIEERPAQAVATVNNLLLKKVNPGVMRRQAKTLEEAK